MDKRDLKKYGPCALGAALLGGGYYWYKNRKAAGAKKTAMGQGLDLLGEDEIVFVGKGGGGGHGGGGHGGHGGHGRGRGGWEWGGGPYFWGPWYSDGIEVDELDAPTAEEVAAELAKHLKGHAS